MKLAHGTDSTARAKQIGWQRVERILGYRRRGVLIKVLLTAIFVVVAFVFIIPFYWMLVSSLRPSELIFTESNKFIPSRVTLETYRELFAQLPYLRWYLNSVVMTGSFAFLSVIVCTLGGFALAQYRFPFRDTIFLTILGSQMIPFHLLLIPLFTILVRFKLIDTYLGAIVPLVAHPFGLFYMRQYMLGISSDLLDAARVDGASEYRLFYEIVLPLVKPAMGTLMILFSMEFWNNLLWPLIVMRTEEKLPLAVGIAGLVNQYRPQYDLVMAASALASVPIMILFLLMQRQFITGMTATALVIEK